MGSIGVYTIHEDLSERLKAKGISVTFIAEGPLKVEGNVFEPLLEEARNALAANVRYYYNMFTQDVAKSRGVLASVVRADPDKSDKHFGGGPMYPAQVAVDLGTADRVDTLEATILRLRGNSTKRRRRADTARRRLALA